MTFRKIFDRRYCSLLPNARSVCSHPLDNDCLRPRGIFKVKGLTLHCLAPEACASPLVRPILDVPVLRRIRFGLVSSPLTTGFCLCPDRVLPEPVLNIWPGPGDIPSPLAANASLSCPFTIYRILVECRQAVSPWKG